MGGRQARGLYAVLDRCAICGSMYDPKTGWVVLGRLACSYRCMLEAADALEPERGRPAARRKGTC